jgi:hypothetical protein
MNPLVLHELAQITEQERMNAQLHRAAVRAARREAGVSWVDAVRGRFFGRNGHAPVSHGAVNGAPRVSMGGAAADCVDCA